MLLPSNGESALDAFEDTESALRAAGTRTFPSLLALQEEPAFWKPEPIGYNTWMQCSLALYSQANITSLQDGRCLHGKWIMNTWVYRLEGRGSARCAFHLTTASHHSSRLLHPGDLKKASDARYLLRAWIFCRQGASPWEAHLLASSPWLQ